MKEESYQELLRIARETLVSVVRDQRMPDITTDNPELTAKQGAFVTLRKNGALRGCIGQFIADKPLYQMVIDMTYASATEDPRFYNIRLTRDELDEVDIEISVLSPLEEIDDPLDFELGVHGIYIQKGGASGVFLPQVATETGWNKEEFLTNICTQKAGLAPDAWKNADTKVLRFSAEILEEKGTSAQ